MTEVLPVPRDREGFIPYICVEDAKDSIAFYEKAFEAQEEYRLENQGQVGHAELRVFGHLVMLSDPYPDVGAVPPRHLGGTPVTLHMYVEDVDAVIARAVAAGATLEREVADQFYGDRSGMVIDPSGHRWSFSTYIEDLSPEELQGRANDLFGA